MFYFDSNCVNILFPFRFFFAFCCFFCHWTDFCINFLIFIFVCQISDKMKEGTIAKLAYQTSELYADAMKLMQMGSIRDLWPKVRRQYIVSKMQSEI